jgi:hypothetical protein
MEGLYLLECGVGGIVQSKEEWRKGVMEKYKINTPIIQYRVWLIG